MEKELAPVYYEGIPFSRISPKTVEKSRALATSTHVPGLLGLMGAALGGGALEHDRYNVRPDGYTARKTNIGTDMAIVSVANCLPKGNVRVSASGAERENVARLAFEAIQHYAKIPIVRYFLGLVFSEEVLRQGHISPDTTFDWRKYLAQLYSGSEALLLEIYDELPDGGLITDERMVNAVRKYFELPE